MMMDYGVIQHLPVKVTKYSIIVAGVMHAYNSNYVTVVSHCDYL